MGYEIAVSVTVAMMSFILSYIAIHWNRESKGASGFQLLFLGTSILLLVLDAGYLIDIADSGGATNLRDLLSDTLWWVMLVFFFVFVAMIIMTFAWSVLDSVNEKKETKEKNMYLKGD